MSRCGTRWETNIPPWLYARFYVSWRKVRRDVKVLSEVFTRYGAKRIIEFGCGVGRHGYMLSKLGFEVLLTDIRNWRYGVARRLPFIKFNVLKDSVVGEFDGGYGIGLIAVFKLQDMVRALRNMALNIRSGGVLVVDYNFTTYNEPKETAVKVRGRTYRAILRWEDVRPIEGGVMYRYRVDIVDEHGNVVGVEDTGYPIYDKEVFFKALRNSGLEISEVIWVNWDPNKYMYVFTPGEPDSAFIVLRKP